MPTIQTTLFVEQAALKHVLDMRLSEINMACEDVSHLLSANANHQTEMTGFLDLYCQLYTTEKTSDIDQLGYCCQLAKKLLVAQGYTPLNYSKETEKHYRVIPSNMVEMTIRPAIQRLSDQSVISKGEHYVLQKQIGA